MTEELTGAITTAIGTIKTDVVSVLVIIIPVALAIAGMTFVVRKAMSWFKSMSK